MSPFSKVEMSSFVVLKLKLQHERYGAGRASTTDEPKRANPAGSRPTSKAQNAETTPGGGTIVSLGASGERLCRAYQASGAVGLISKRRGQPSNNRLSEKTINKARQLLRSRYSDFGPTLATEKLAIEGVSLSVETVRQLLIGEGLWKAKSIRRPVIHQLRERRPRLGELVQGATPQKLDR
jgi:hypothetical protein